MKVRSAGSFGMAAAVALLLAGCGSSGGTAGTATSAPTTAGAGTSSGSSPSSSATSASSAAPSSVAPSPSSAGGATSASAGGVQLDGQSVSWFSTVCSGITTVQQMQPPGRGTSLNAAGDTLVTTGQDLTRIAQELQGKPAPTFSGADEFAPAAQNAFATVGGKLTALGQQAQGLQPGDQAGAQQFLDDYQAFVQEMQQVLAPTLNLQRNVLQAVVAQVPECQVLSAAL